VLLRPGSRKAANCGQARAFAPVGTECLLACAKRMRLKASERSVRRFRSNHSRGRCGSVHAGGTSKGVSQVLFRLKIWRTWASWCTLLWANSIFVIRVSPWVVARSRGAAILSSSHGTNSTQTVAPGVATSRPVGLDAAEKGCRQTYQGGSRYHRRAQRDWAPQFTTALPVIV